MFLKVRPQNTLSVAFCMIFQGAQLLEKSFPTNKDLFSGNLEVQIHGFGDFYLFKNLEFEMKLVHMARYELILRLDGAIWLRIILKPLLTQKWRIKVQHIPKRGLLECCRPWWKCVPGIVSSTKACGRVDSNTVLPPGGSVPKIRKKSKNPDFRIFGSFLAFPGGFWGSGGVWK